MRTLELALLMACGLALMATVAVWRTARHRVYLAPSIAFGALALVAAVALPLALPVFRFPTPTGPYRIGTLTYHWVDAGRDDIFSAAPGARRELRVQIWYPAHPVSGSRPAPYLQDADAVTSAFARIQHKPAFLFEQFKYVTTNAWQSAPAAGDPSSHPVLMFLEGSTGFRQMNTFQVEELVSHGYIVVAIDQPGVAAEVVFPDNRERVGLPRLQLQALIRPSYMATETAPPLAGRTLQASSVVPYLVQDAIFTLDRLTALNRADPNGILTGRLDLQQVGAFGVSLGGIVVGELCRRDPRVHACLMMDAPMAIETVAAGVKKPGLWITRDAQSMRLERRRSGGWSEAEIAAHEATMRAAYNGSSSAAYFVQVPGTFHSNFMDVPEWSPLTSVLGISGPINGRRAHDIINAYSLAFFNRHLRARTEALLERPARQFPEVIFESRAP